MNIWTVDVLDAKGDRWELMAPPIDWALNRNGMYVLWMAVRSGPAELTKYYDMIPVPCFTEWWV